MRINANNTDALYYEANLYLSLGKYYQAAGKYHEAAGKYFHFMTNAKQGLTASVKRQKQ